MCVLMSTEYSLHEIYGMVHCRLCYYDMSSEHDMSSEQCWPVMTYTPVNCHGNISIQYL